MWNSFKEKLKGWKTIVFNALVGAPVALLALLDEFKAVDLSSILSPQWAARIVTLMAIAGILLRLVTTGPVGSKGDEAPPPETKAGD